MTFAEKISRIFSRDGYQSLTAGLRRLTYPLPVEPFIAAIDSKAFDQLRSKYYVPNEHVLPAKYLNLDEWMRTSVKRIRDLRVKKAPPRLRILDLGCGSGYFLHVAKCLGHDVLGLDCPGDPIFTETLELLGIPRVLHFIHSFQPLPDLGAPFDLITAHMTCFNRRADGSHWGVEEWDYFLKDLDPRLNRGGRLQFDLNVLPDGRHMADDVREFFRSKGARIDRRRAYFSPKR